MQTKKRLMVLSLSLIFLAGSSFGQKSPNKPGKKELRYGIHGLFFVAVLSLLAWMLMASYWDKQYAQGDVKGQDLAFVPRYPQSVRVDYNYEEYAAFDMQVRCPTCPYTENKSVEGKHYFIQYEVHGSMTQLQILRNYENAWKSKGWKIQAAANSQNLDQPVTAEKVDPQSDIWVTILTNKRMNDSEGKGVIIYDVNVIDIAKMEQMYNPDSGQITNVLQPSAPAVFTPAPAPAAAIEFSPESYPTQCPAEGQKISVAVYPIKPAGSDPALAAAMTALISGQLAHSPKLKVIEEAMLKTVMERQGLNASDACDDTSCQVEIGKLVKAQKLIAGDLSKLGQKYVFSLKLTDIQTGALEFTSDVKCSCPEDQLDKLVEAAAAQVRNHFCEQVAVSAAVAAPRTAALSAENLYVYADFQAFGTQPPDALHIILDKPTIGKLTPSNPCLKKSVTPGNHRLGIQMVAGSKVTKEMVNRFDLPSGQREFLKVAPSSIQVQSEAEAAGYLQNCQAVP